MNYKKKLGCRQHRYESAIAHGLILLPARASEQGNVIGSVRIYIYIYIYICTHFFGN